MHHDDGAPSSPKLREKLCQATWDSWFLDVTSSSGLCCLRRIINPLENRGTCFHLYPEGWTAHFLFLQLKPHCHSVLLSVVKYGGKLWAGRGREEQLPVQGHRVNMRYPVGFKFTGKQWINTLGVLICLPWRAGYWAFLGAMQQFELPNI